MVDTAVAELGGLDVLVNNAGFLRDRMLVSMRRTSGTRSSTSTSRATSCPPASPRPTGASRPRQGAAVKASIIHTSSTSGLLGNPGQTNYGAAKAGIGAFSIICAQELGRYGVRSNCLAPAARTRLTESTPGLGDVVARPTEGFDLWDPANVSPLVAYLATAGCDITGRTFFVQGGTVRVMEPWQLGDRIERDGRWTVDELAAQVPGLFSS